MIITCPSCKQRCTWEENPWRPFCSERCKMIDLGNWAMEQYKIPEPISDENKDTDNIHNDRREP
ncbi:MAG TPA: DNA gyrase inhibitor YacG [Dissulfurispiraceae bacterium]|nr:DNA gyrase inhibitor YacG [Dissulfurispiraceae bacterium]